MKKSLVISEQDSIGALLENDRVVEFFVNRGELLLGDIYTASVENILPGIDAAFVNLGKDKMGFLHANDVPGQGFLKERLVPKQKLLVQITKEPTGHKGPRVSTAISLPGRFLVLVPEERGVSISRRISEAKERARLKSVVNLLKPPGVGLIIRTEAKGQDEQALYEDFELLWDRWQTIVSEGEASIGPSLIYRDQDLLYRVIRDAFSHDVSEIIVDSEDGQKRAQEYLTGWAGRQTRVLSHPGDDSLLLVKGIDKEIEAALSDRAELPSGGHLNIQPTEALTVIDVNSGRFTSSRTQAETVRRTNLEAAQEIPRQLRLRNIGGMVIVDFIDMDSRKDQQQVLEQFQRALEDDRAKPQCGQLSDLGLVELTRRRQGQSLRELFTIKCGTCVGLGVTPNLELGTAENRRVISFHPEESHGGKRGQRRGGGRQAAVLRAASAANGRVVPTAGAHEIEEEILADVPEEILEQMPDELLDDRRAKAAQKMGAFSDKDNGLDEEDDEHGSTKDPLHDEDEEPINFRADFSRTREALVFEEPDHETFADQISANAKAVEQVFNEMESSPYSESRHEHNESPASHDTTSSYAAEASRESYKGLSNFDENNDSGHKEQTEAKEADLPLPAEVDPVTGIYRLKLNKPHHSHSEDHHEHSEDATTGGAKAEGQPSNNWWLPNSQESHGHGHDHGQDKKEESEEASQLKIGHIVVGGESHDSENESNGNNDEG